MRLIGAVLSGLALLFSLCCCSRAVNPDAFSVRDSVGIQIAVSTVPAWSNTQRFRVLDTPILDLGGAEAPPEFQFQQLLDLALLRNGNIVATDMSARRVLFFSEDGEPLAQQGRQGTGPGEFRLLFGLAILGDSVIAYDRNFSRVTVFSSDGQFLGVRTFEDPPAGNPPLRNYYLVGSVDGDLLFTPRVFLPSTSGDVSVYRDTAPNLLYDVSLGFDAEVAEPSGMDMFSSVQGASSVPFGRISVIASSEETVFICHGRDFEIRQFEPGRGLTHIIRRPYHPRPVTEEDLQELIARHLQNAGASSANDPRFDGFRAMMESAPLPEFMPTIDGLIADALGFLWARHYSTRPGEAPREWSVFSSEGRWLGEVTMPVRFRPSVIREDYVLGVYSDAYDVEHIQKLPLVRQ